MKWQDVAKAVEEQEQYLVETLQKMIRINTTIPPAITIRNFMISWSLSSKNTVAILSEYSCRMTWRKWPRLWGCSN